MALEELRKMYINGDLHHREVPEEEVDIDDDDDNIWAKCMSRAMKQNTYSSQIKLDQNHAAKLDAEIIENTSSTIRIRNSGIGNVQL